MTTHAIDVANWFVAKHHQDPQTHAPLTFLKLLMLVWKTQAWHLGNTGKPLFDDPTEAWTFGPVVKSVHSAFQNQKNDPVIRSMAMRPVFVNTNFVKTLEVPSPNVFPFLEKIWETHKTLTEIQLCNATHGPQEPWTLVMKALGTEHTPIIPNNLTAEVFAKKVAKGSAA